MRDKFKVDPPHAIHFSGGRTSALMLRRPSGKKPKVPTYVITDLGSLVRVDRRGMLLVQHQGYRVSWGYRALEQRVFRTHAAACAFARAEIGRHERQGAGA